MDILKGSNIKAKEVLVSIAMVIASSLVIGFSSNIYIPLTPIPFTSQTLVILLIGALLGRKRAVSAVVLYMVEGALGLPFFATGVGLGIMYSPAFGYVIGFLFSAYIAGYCSDKGYLETFVGSFFSFFVANQIVFVVGLSYLYFFLGNVKLVLAVGYIPFIGFDFIKIIVSTICASSIVKLKAKLIK